MDDALVEFAIHASITWSAKCPHCGVVMFRASEQAIREAAVSHPCPPPVLPPLVEGTKHD